MRPDGIFSWVNELHQLEILTLSLRQTLCAFMLLSFFIHINAPNGFSLIVHTAAASASVNADADPIQHKAVLYLHQLKLRWVTAY